MTDMPQDGITPLGEAAWAGHLGMLELLMRHGADLEATDHVRGRSSSIALCCRTTCSIKIPARTGGRPSLTRVVKDTRRD